VGDRSADATPGVAVPAAERFVHFDFDEIVERGYELDIRDFAAGWGLGSCFFDQGNCHCDENIAAALCDYSHDQS